MTQKRSAWQEPMVWLMAGIPALTVVAGFYTLYLAVDSGPLDSVPASVQKAGLAQVLDSAEDRLASEQNYRAYLMIDDRQQPWTLSIKTVPETLLGSDVELVFVHPNSTDQDVAVVLPANAASLTMATALAFKPQQVVLRDVNKTWRLVGSYDGQSMTTLTPALHSQ